MRVLSLVSSPDERDSSTTSPKGEGPREAANALYFEVLTNPDLSHEERMERLAMAQYIRLIHIDDLLYNIAENVSQLRAY